MKKLMTIGIVTLLVTLTVTVTAQAAPPRHFYLEKVCADPVAPFCDLQNAQPAGVLGVLNGGRLEYLGPIILKTDPHLFVSSEVVLTGTDGSTVQGHFRWVGDHGYFTLRQGTGALAGLHAEGVIEYVEGATFSLTGAYHFSR